MLRPFVCAVVLVVSLHVAQSDPVQPKEGAKQKWSDVTHTYRTLNRASYYKVYAEPRTWFEASNTCEKDGSHLLIVNSPEEAIEVKKFLDPDVETYIIGFHDLFEEGRFLTVQCRTIAEAGYTTWAFSEPSNFSNEDCGGITRDAELADISCNVAYPFICELEI